MNERLLTVLGWVGSMAFALSALPQTILVVRQGHADGMDPAFLGLWFLGEICMIVSTWHLRHWPLRANYLINFALLCIIIYYFFLPG